MRRDREGGGFDCIANNCTTLHHDTEQAWLISPTGCATRRRARGSHAIARFARFYGLGRGSHQGKLLVRERARAMKRKNRERGRLGMSHGWADAHKYQHESQCMGTLVSQRGLRRKLSVNRYAPPDFKMDSINATPIDTAAVATEYDSLSKTLQRTRILANMQEFYADTGVAPSLIYLGAPQGADSAFFQEAVDTGKLPVNSKFTAVNCSTFDVRVKEMKNVAVVENALLLDVVASADARSFSHAWLDLTELEPEPSLYVSIRRVLRDVESRDSVYINVAKRTRTFDDCVRVLRSMCSTYAYQITHLEDYIGGSTKQHKKNMLFVACRLVPTKASARPENLVRSKIVGCNAWVTKRRGRPKDLHVHKTSQKYNHHLCYIREWNASNDTYRVSFYATDDTLYNSTCDLDPSEFVTVSLCSRKMRHTA